MLKKKIVLIPILLLSIVLVVYYIASWLGPQQEQLKPVEREAAEEFKKKKLPLSSLKDGEKSYNYKDVEAGLNEMEIDPAIRKKILRFHKKKRMELEVAFNNISLVKKEERDDALAGIEREKFLKALNVLTELRLNEKKFGKNTAWIVYQMGNIHFLRLSFPKALNHYIRASKAKPLSPKYKESIGFIYFITGKHFQALFIFKQVLALHQKNHGINNPMLVQDWDNLVDSYMAIGQFKKALFFLEKTIPHVAKLFDEMDIRYGTRFHRMGEIYSGMANYNEAIKNYKKALRVVKASQGEESQWVINILSEIGKAFHKSGNHKKVIQYFSQVLILRQKKSGIDHVSIATACQYLSAAYLQLGDYNKAMYYARTAYRVVLRDLGPNHLKTALACKNLGSTYYSLADYAKSIEYYRMALRIFKKKFENNHPYIIDSRQELMRATQKLRKSKTN